MKTARQPSLYTAISIILASAVLTACAGLGAGPSAPPSSGHVVLVDGMARAVTIPAAPKRILSIAPSATEILFALGAAPQMVGRDELSDYPEEAVQLASIGSTFGDLNREAIVALEPDLVIAAMINSPEHVQAIEELGIPIFVIPNPTSFEDLYQILEVLGGATGRVQEVADLVASLKVRVDAALAVVEGAEPVSVYFEVDGTDFTAPWTTGRGTFHDVLITLAGGENIAGDLENYVQINLEELVARDPEVMMFSLAPWIPTTSESVADRAGWSGITAVAHGAIYGIDSNWIDRPGPRLVNALEAMVAALHPKP